MKDHLKKSVSAFSKLKLDTEIHPISEVDVEIIVEVIEALKKIGKSDLVSILENWKYHKDEQVRDDLLEWNTNFKADHIDETPAKYPFKWVDSNTVLINGQIFTRERIFTYITLNGVRYCLNDIFNYSTFEEYKFDTSKFVYGIRLNEYPDDATFRKEYADKKIIYPSKKLRDADFKKLDEAFIGQLNIRVID